MPIPVTALYAGILALLVIVLAINVTVTRAKLRISIGDGDDPLMSRMIRVHGNAIEYIPLAVLLMLTYELNGGTRVALHVAGFALVAGRLLHAWGLWASNRFGRIPGQCLTWLTIAVLAILNLLRVM
jgi:uncharacterized membrane protein YecN with MAPEG domain